MSSWSEEDRNFALQNAGKMSFEEIGRAVGRSKNAVHLFLHRQRKSYKPTVRKNLIIEILDLAFTKAEYFNPTREFFETVGITQMRFWSLYRGEASPTEQEYKTIKEHLGVTSEQVFENRQLSIFDEKSNR